jgi:hypothetical protein
MPTSRLPLCWSTLSPSKRSPLLVSSCTAFVQPIVGPSRRFLRVWSSLDLLDQFNFKFIWIIGSLLASWEHLVLWQAVFQITLTVIFTFLQLYTLTIHYTLYKKCGAFKVQRAEPIKGVLDMDDQESGDDFEIDKTTPISMEFEA